MADVIQQVDIDSSKVKDTWVKEETITNIEYNSLSKAVLDLVKNNNLLDSNSMLFREQYNSSSKDLNNAIHQGMYSFTSDCLNAPPDTNGGNILVANTSKTEQGSSIVITQLALCHNGSMYVRTKNTTENFTNWILIAGNSGGIKSITGSNDKLTITNGNNTQQDITINNVAHSTNADNSTKATQDKNGLQIDTGYLKLSGGEFKGNITYSRTDTELKIHGTGVDNWLYVSNIYGIGMWDNKYRNQIWSYKQSERKLFSEVPTITVPTPEITANNTQIATTAFVQSLLTQKFTASKQENGWWKDGNTGMIWQWGKTDTFDISQVILKNVTFPISFSSNPLLIIPALEDDTDTYFSASVAYCNPTPNGCTLKVQEWSTPAQKATLRYLAIGYV